MSRWQPNARERLQRAAMELFLENGFSETTVPQITARAGLTTRSFFRHFADKREVLFASANDFPVMLERMVSEAPASLSLMQLIEYSLEKFAKTSFEGHREALKNRQAIIQGDDGLREREMRKREALTEALIRGFQARGFAEQTSIVAAQLASSVFSVTLSRWLELDPEQPLSEMVQESFRVLHTITADSAN